MWRHYGERNLVKARRIFETVLYAHDLAAAAKFYQDVLGLQLIESTGVYLALRCQSGVLLVFHPERSGAPGRPVPSHGAQGPGHVAFAARDEDLAAWRQHLEKNGVAIEDEVEWGGLGRSIYFRDPAGNSVELAPPTLWGGGWKFSDDRGNGDPGAP